MTETRKEIKERIVMCLIPGMPAKDGWYFVKLIPGHINGNQEYDVDYCRKKSASDGGGREWVKWYEHNVSHYAEINNTNV